MKEKGLVEIQKVKPRCTESGIDVCSGNSFNTYTLECKTEVAAVFHSSWEIHMLAETCLWFTVSSALLTTLNPISTKITQNHRENTL